MSAFKEMKQRSDLANILWYSVHGDMIHPIKRMVIGDDNNKTKGDEMPSYKQMGDDLTALEHSNEMLEEQNADLHREIELLQEHQEPDGMSNDQMTFIAPSEKFAFIERGGKAVCNECDLFHTPHCLRAPCSPVSRFDEKVGVYKRVNKEETDQ